MRVPLAMFTSRDHLYIRGARKEGYNLIKNKKKRRENVKTKERKSYTSERERQPFIVGLFLLEIGSDWSVAVNGHGPASLSRCLRLLSYRTSYLLISKLKTTELLLLVRLTAEADFFGRPRFAHISQPVFSLFHVTTLLFST